MAIVSVEIPEMLRECKKWQCGDLSLSNICVLVNQNILLLQIVIWCVQLASVRASTATPESIPDPRQHLNTNAEFCCVLKTKLAGHSLLYGAEVDALRKECQPPFSNLENFVELKTNRHIETERQNDSFLK